MSTKQRPQEKYEDSGEAVPVGWVRANALLAYVLPAIWGEEFVARALSALPEDTTPDAPGDTAPDSPDDTARASMIIDAIDTGRCLYAVRCIAEAVHQRDLNPRKLIAKKSAGQPQPEHIPPSHWASLTEHDLMQVFLRGTSQRIW